MYQCYNISLHIPWNIITTLTYTCRTWCLCVALSHLMCPWDSSGANKSMHFCWVIRYFGLDADSLPRLFCFFLRVQKPRSSRGHCEYINQAAPYCMCRFPVLFSARALCLSEEAGWEVIHLRLTATSLASCWSPRERKRSLTAQEHIPPPHRGDKAI